MELLGQATVYGIILMGAAGAALILERMKVLFFDYSIKTQQFMSQIRSLIMSDQEKGKKEKKNK